MKTKKLKENSIITMQGQFKYHKAPHNIFFIGNGPPHLQVNLNLQSCESSQR